MAWLFSRATTDPQGTSLYAAIVAEMRRSDFYLAGGVPDTMDGRFAVLSSLLALVDIRLGQGDDSARAMAPRLAERFIGDMDVQMREAGFSDPGLGKQVRMMVGSLASRVDRFQTAFAQVASDGGGGAWNAAVVPSLYRDAPPDEAAVEEGSALLRGWWQRIEQVDDAALAKGQI